MLTPVQTGSKLARSACGTRRNVRAAARWEIAGVARPPAVASAPAPTADFKNVRRSMMCARSFWPLADHGASAQAYSPAGGKRCAVGKCRSLLKTWKDRSLKDSPVARHVCCPITPHRISAHPVPWTAYAQDTLETALRQI